VGLFPTVSTVTYLTDVPHTLPTVILDNKASTPVGAPISRVFVSIPAVGKHISFDGRLLHGAPKEFVGFATSADDKESSKKTASAKVCACMYMLMYECVVVCECIGSYS
jgi:hypothetical protein